MIPPGVGLSFVFVGTVVNLLLSQWGHLFTNAEEWTGHTHVSPDGRTIISARHGLPH